MSDRKKRILIVSSSNMDLDARLQTVPEGGQTVVGDEYEYVPGGKGANSALTVARLGEDVIFRARLGSDASGDRLVSVYAENGIDTRFIARDPSAPTGLALILIDASGQNRIVVYPGANMKLGRGDVEYAFSSIPDALMMQLEIPAETVLFAAEYGRKKNIPVIIDAGPAVKDFPLEQLGPVEIFSPNETECEAYTGIRPAGTETCLQAVCALEKRIKAKYYVLKLGGRGCYVYDGKYQRSFMPYDTPVVDTTAAGDAFTAALTMEYIKSGDISRACVFANIVGSMVVSKAGASTSIPTMDEAERFIAEKGIRFPV